MTQTCKINHDAIMWLEKFSEDLDSDSDMIDTIPIGDVRKKLRDMGADVEGFHKRLSKRFSAAKLKDKIKQIILWISPLWEPQWAGVPVTCSDIPPQTQPFITDDGDIQITCHWRSQYNKKPAYIQISWEANITDKGELYARFVNPDTHEILSEVCLGKNLKGEEIFTAEDLGFDPSATKWGISVLLKGIK